MPRSRAASAVSMGTCRRSYGFSTEPTILAFYLNTLGVIGIWNLCESFQIKRLLKSLLVFSYIIAWLTTISAVALVALPFSLFVCYFLIKLRQPLFSKRGTFVAVVCCIMLCVSVPLTLSDKVTPYFAPIYHKLSLNQEKEGSRPQRWKSDLSVVSESPWTGQGLGYATSAGRGSSVNWYLFLTMEGGLISSLPAILFLFFSFIRIYFSQVPGKLWFMSAFMAGSIHLVTISAFFHPFLWTLLKIGRAHV